MTTQWSVEKVRSTFIKFFEERDHVFVPSSPVVPYDDPTLLFANAGMNQFKPIFLGTIDPNQPFAKLKRAVNSQKCIRAGGKHNDLDDVGKDTYHHTFFEMLGTWSFGDYFKESAIDWAWELLTKVYHLPVERLYATYFGGDEKNGVPVDEEAKKIWMKYLPEERVLPFVKDNFWEMGNVGPCGPCTEIHFDRVGGRNAADLVNRDNPEVIEVWNLVFMQYNRENDGSLKLLPSQHVDTGMGLERLTSILQNVSSNYDSDVFMPLFKAIQQVTGSPDYGGKVGAEDVTKIDMAYRVLADHIRTLTFAITDGALPDSDGRGYVLRRVLRRAVRYGRQVLNCNKKGFFAELVPYVVQQMKGFFPELEKGQETVIQVLLEEEEAFDRTLNHGIEMLSNIFKNRTEEKIITGAEAFELYSTHGFPIDLTQLMAEEKGFEVQKEEYSKLMEQQVYISKLASKSGLDSAMNLDADATSELMKKKIPTTNDEEKYYSLNGTTGTILAIWVGKHFVNEFQSNKNTLCGIVLDKTNFYAESGGQIYDTGKLLKGDGPVNSFLVENVQSYAGYVLHIGKLQSGAFKVGDELKLQINMERRLPTMVNHTFTHILNFALRKVLNDPNIDQKGSLCDEEKLRFDFSYRKPLTTEEIDKVEQICNQHIQQKLQVYSLRVALQEAKKITGIRAVFGETYPDPVTVISIGKSVEDLLKQPDNLEWWNYSIEFCGGTHLKNTEQAKHFVIISDSSIARGVRRIVAFTGDKAQQVFDVYKNISNKIAQAKSVKPEELKSIIAALSNDLVTTALPEVYRSQLKKELDDLVTKKNTTKKENLKSAKETMDEIIAKSAGSQLIIEELDLKDDRKALNTCLKTLQKNFPETAILLTSRGPKQAAFLTYVGPSLQSKLSASDWAQHVASVAGGKGGGKAESGQGSGDVNQFEQAIQAARDYATSKLK